MIGENVRGAPGETHPIVGIRKIGRMEGGKGEEFPSVVAALGFTKILTAFSGVGVWARLSYEGIVLDGPFNPTYGLSLHW